MVASTYAVTVDSTRPDISLVSPEAGSIKQAGVDIVLSISDTNLMTVNYTVNDLITIVLSSPFVISTTGWEAPDYSIEVRASDKAGNINNLTFDLTLDSIRPVISLNSPADNSEITPGTPIDIDVADIHLVGANYTINDGEVMAFTAHI